MVACSWITVVVHCLVSWRQRRGKICVLGLESVFVWCCYVSVICVWTLGKYTHHAFAQAFPVDSAYLSNQVVCLGGVDPGLGGGPGLH